MSGVRSLCTSRRGVHRGASPTRSGCRGAAGLGGLQHPSCTWRSATTFLPSACGTMPARTWVLAVAGRQRDHCPGGHHALGPPLPRPSRSLRSLLMQRAASASAFHCFGTFVPVVPHTRLAIIIAPFRGFALLPQVTQLLSLETRGRWSSNAGGESHARSWPRRWACCCPWREGVVAW